jgi:uncharacterized protein (DUF2336 family)
MKQPSPELISQEDFFRLKQNPQPYARAAIAQKIANCFDVGTSDSAEYKVAAEIAMYLQKDKNEMVRMALAKGLYQSSTAPKKLILLLANDDEDQVVIPILRHSPLLEDNDLAVLVKEMESQVRLAAIAERRFLSTVMSALVAEKAYEKVSVSLLDNETSKISNATYLRIASLHKQSKMVLQQMMKRVPMPVDAITMMQKLSAESTQENQPATRRVQSFAALPMQELRNMALAVMVLSDHAGAEQCMMLAKQFHQHGKINASLLIVALTQGQIGLFFACLSVATGIEYDDIEVHYANQVDKLNGLMVKAGISPSLMMFIQWVWKGANTKLQQGLKPSSKQMMKLMSINLHEAARRGVNFANTIGLPIANMLDELI